MWELRRASPHNTEVGAELAEVCLASRGFYEVEAELTAALTGQSLFGLVPRIGQAASL